MGIETGISFEVLARITAAFDLVQIMEKRPRPECVKAPREMLQPRPIAAKPDFKPGAVRRLGRGDYRLRREGDALNSFVDMAFPFPLAARVLSPIFCPMNQPAADSLPPRAIFDWEQKCSWPWPCVDVCVEALPLGRNGSPPMAGDQLTPVMIRRSLLPFGQ
jgi:hypothetical protein